MLPSITGEFRAVDDPELRFTPSGQAVANLRIVANSRKKNKDTGEWEDDKVVWLNLTAWGQMAENVAESVTKGTLITVKGRLETRAYETREGEKRQSFDVTADEVGVSLARDAAKVLKAERSSGGGTSATPKSDPFGTPPQEDEPPF
jgi:single-strand DNA-binding protein